MSEDKEFEFIEPVLESPPDVGPTLSEVGSHLFADEAFAPVLAKLSVLESFLRLSTRDCKYNDFMREILLVFLRTVKCEAGSIFEVDHKNKVLFFRSIIGQSSDRLSKFIIPMGQGIVGHVAESKTPSVLDQAHENQHQLKSIDTAVGFETRNLIAVPILIRGQTFGVLELLNRVGEETFTPSDIELLTYLCDMAARIIEVRLMISWNKHHTVSQQEEVA